jgi:hypothetical protein
LHCFLQIPEEDFEIGEDALIYAEEAHANYEPLQCVETFMTQGNSQEVLFEFKANSCEPFGSSTLKIYNEAPLQVPKINFEPPTPDDDKTLVPEDFNMSSEYFLEQLFINSPSPESAADTYNPFQLDFAEIYDRIFSYLDVKDILNLSEVNFVDLMILTR